MGTPVDSFTRLETAAEHANAALRVLRARFRDTAAKARKPLVPPAEDIGIRRAFHFQVYK